MKTSTSTVWPENIPQPKEPIRVALVGTGNRSRTVYMPLFEFLKPYFKLVAVCDPVKANCDAAAELLARARLVRPAATGEGPAHGSGHHHRAGGCAPRHLGVPERARHPPHLRDLVRRDPDPGARDVRRRGKEQCGHARHGKLHPHARVPPGRRSARQRIDRSDPTGGVVRRTHRLPQQLGVDPLSPASGCRNGCRASTTPCRPRRSPPSRSAGMWTSTTRPVTTSSRTICW